MKAEAHAAPINMGNAGFTGQQGNPGQQGGTPNGYGDQDVDFEEIK